MRCCIAQFAFIRRIRVRLVKRHPDVWRALSLKAWSVDGAVTRYVWRDTKALDDPPLAQAIHHLRLIYALGFAAWLTFPAAAIFGLLR